MLQIPPRRALEILGSDRELVNLHGYNVWIGECLDANKALVLCLEYAVFKISKIVEFPQFSCFVSVVQVADEPIRCIPKNISLYRADFLSGVDHTDMVFSALFSSSHPDIFKICFA